MSISVKPVFLTLFMISTFALQVQAEIVDAAKFQDEVGIGLISSGTMDGRNIISQEKIASDDCVNRVTLDNLGQEGIEFDYLGFTENIPAEFKLTDHALRKRTEGDQLVYIKTFPAQSVEYFASYFQKAVCLNGETPTAVDTELLIGKSSLAIRWIVDCADGVKSQTRFRQMKCDITE